MAFFHSAYPEPLYFYLMTKVWYHWRVQR